MRENTPASKGYLGGFGTNLMLNDLGRGMARTIYAAHSIAGHGGEEFSSVIKMLQKKG